MTQKHPKELSSDENEKYNDNKEIKKEVEYSEKENEEQEKEGEDKKEEEEEERQKDLKKMEFIQKIKIKKMKDHEKNKSRLSQRLNNKI